MIRILSWLGIVAIAGGIGVAVGMFIPCSKFATPDWPAWVQAVGSVAAIFAAIWISKAQDRKRNDDALTVAAVVASSMVHRIVQTIQTLRDANERFDTMSQVDGSYTDFGNYLSLLEALPEWRTDDVVRLAALPDNSAHKVAAAIDRTLTAQMLLKKAAINKEITSNSEIRRDYAKKISLALDEAATCYEVAANNMNNFVKKFTNPYL